MTAATVPSDPDFIDPAALLAAHAYHYTHWGSVGSRKVKPAVSVCICKAETPLDLPEDFAHTSDAELTKADRAAHGKHLATVIAENGYDRRGSWEIVVPKPNVLHKGPNDTDADFMRIAARNLERENPVGGSNLTYAVIKLLRDTANSLDAAAAN